MLIFGLSPVDAGGSRLNRERTTRSMTARSNPTTRKREVFIPIGPSIAYVPLTRGKSALIDSEDVALVSRFNWHASPGTTGDFYARRTEHTADGKVITIRMHREILGINNERLTDHANGNTLDNRKSNLRSCTDSQSVINTIRKPNSCGVRGVHFDRSKGKWKARIGVDGRSISLGYFLTKEDAASVRKQAERKYHGEFGTRY